jgi:UDP-N-acetylglucosamine--N-acetylmuramyl-(pentapeptide) pyrophosphoryl-undecaprenol N-acetylglucosamine transferase
VLGFGGFASFPGALAGIALARPLVLHDANAIAGLANRVLAYAADRILLGFPDAMRGRHAAKVEWVGNPVRDAIGRVPAPAVRYADRSGPLRLLVVGGSLGAAAINRCVPLALALMSPAARPQVVHQSGARHVDALRAAYAQAGIAARCVPFIEDMAAHYADADVVLCRGGAITVAELAAAGVASIIVPLPGAIADEQSANAQFLVAAGAALTIAQGDLTPGRLAAELGSLSRATLLAMAIAARSLARLDAADRVADACVALGARP